MKILINAPIFKLETFSKQIEMVIGYLKFITY